MPAFVVRPALLRDRDGIDDMLSRSYPPLLAPAYAAELLTAAWPAMTRANPKLLERETWFVAIAEDELVVGCGGWTPERPGTGEREPGLGHVRHFGTHVDHLRQGIARMIASRMLASARAAGITQLDCDSTIVAEPFYAALGFRTIGPTTVTMPCLDRPGEFVEFPSLLMRLAI
jgi:GNAT superfamily N-acetyltransferase